MGRIYQVDYERAFALCADLERILDEMEGQAAGLRRAIEPLESDWIPHGMIGRAHGETIAHRARIVLGESRAAIATLRQSLHSLKALEEEQARRMRSARA